MSEFNALTVESIRPLTADSVEISFSVPDELVDQYSYEHGQFVLLRTTIGGELIERAYSICRAPYERKLNVAVKRVENGIFSSYATSILQEGDSIEVSKPSGVFTCSLDSSKAKNYFFAAAGSGITPVIAIIKMVLASEPQSKCVLMYGNKEAAGVMFADEIIDLKKRYQDRLQILWVFSQGLFDGKKYTQESFSQVGEIHYGRVTNTLIQKLLDNEVLILPSMVFLCGPEPMTLSLRDYFNEQDVPFDDIKIELFSAAELLGDAAESVSNAQISLLIDGEELDVVYEDATESILEHALRIDPDLPYGCQNGSCGACQAKLIYGKASMVTNYALSESEVEEGYILLCQARPESVKVSISYDE